MSDGKSIKLQMIEGEYIFTMLVHKGHLYLGTNLGRIFKSTDVPAEYVDFVELKEED